MKLSIANIAAAVIVAATVAPNGASASLAEHTTEQRELWGSGWYKWTPKEPEECYDVRKSMSFFLFLWVSVGFYAVFSMTDRESLALLAIRSHIFFSYFTMRCDQQFDKCFDCLDECKDKAEYAEKKCDMGWKPDWYGCDESSCSDQAKCIFDKCKMKCDGCSGMTAMTIAALAVMIAEAKRKTAKKTVAIAEFSPQRKRLMT